jgi:hypothetical protein
MRPSWNGLGAFRKDRMPDRRNEDIVPTRYQRVSIGAEHKLHP